MKLYINQRIITFRDHFKITDQNDIPVFDVVGKFFTLAKRFTIYNRHDESVGVVREHFFSIFPHYTIESNDKAITLKRSWSIFRQKYVIKGTDWSIKGDLWNHNYQIVSKRDGLIMTLKRKLLTLGDRYELDIIKSDNAILALGIVLAIDAEIGKDRRRSAQPNQGAH